VEASTVRRCERCGTQLSRYNHESVCAPCRPALPPEQGTVPTPRLSHPLAAGHPPGPTWLWVSPATQAALASGDLATILAAYRRANRLSQAELAAILGLDQPYVSRIERGARKIRDIRTLARIADRLAIPPHLVGVVGTDDTDFATMLQFAEATLRLSEVARQSGHAADAVSELWPLVARLETRLSEGKAERDVLILLAHGRLALGTALGHVLPEERLAVAARWTARAWLIADWLGDDVLKAKALRMHGNELRKCSHHAAAVARLAQALSMTRESSARGATLGLLARAAAEAGDAVMFDLAVAEALALLEAGQQPTMFFNEFSLREIHTRGLLMTGRVPAAVALADGAAQQDSGLAMAPQWRVINQVTVGDVLLADGDVAGTLDILRAAMAAAETYRLPHQIQRAMRTLRSVPSDAGRALAEAGAAALARLRRLLAAPTISQ
jgi:transcriptional regulator with XRE-family HTH domain